MAAAKVGDDFIKYEFDEAIAIHGGIVEAQMQRWLAAFAVATAPVDIQPT